MNFIKYKWEIFIAIIVFCFLGTGMLAYVAYHSTPPSYSSTTIEVTKIILLCLGGLGVILPTYINATNSLEGRLSSKIENTFSLIAKWDDSHLFSARKLTRDIKKNRSKMSDEDLINKIESTEELHQSVILVLNYFEHVRFSLVNDRIDKELFKATLGVVVVDIIGRFSPFTNKIGGQVVTDLKQLVDLLK